MVAPAAARAAAVRERWRSAARFAFGVAASLLRLAFGGHYLSDVLLGGLIALIVIEITRRAAVAARRALKGCAPARAGL